MSNLRQAAQAALDALLSCTAVPHWPSLLPAINDLRAALAEPTPTQDDPVAWIDKHGHIDQGLDAILDPEGWIPLYLAAPSIPAGWKLVPVEPTEGVCSRGQDGLR